MIKNLISLFLKGLIIFVPILFISYVLVSIYSFFKRLFPETNFLIILIFIFSFFTILGFLLTNKFANRINELIKNKLRKFSPIHSTYITAEKILKSPMKQKKFLSKPVIVTDPGTKHRKIGFVTQDDLKEFGLEDHVTVFFPQAFTFDGETLLIKSEDLNLLDADGSKIYTMIISGGMTITPIEEGPKEK
jgi:uncharacterized membrane protein